MSVSKSEKPLTGQDTIPENPMRFVRASPNLKGMSGAELFLLAGNATLGQVDHIDADPAWKLAQSTATSRTTPFRLRVLHFNDLHGSICRLTSRREQPVFARMVSLVRRLRRRYQDNPDVAVMFVTGGDEQAGSFFDELLDRDEVVLKTHASYRAYSAAGVDAGVIGNHDLDRGANLLTNAIQQDAFFPVLSANAISQQHLNWLDYPAAVFRVKGVRIGLIGLTTAGQIKCNKTDITIFDPLETVRNLLPAFKPYCDMIVILSHLGYNSAADSAIVYPLGDRELAEGLEYCEVDLIVGGHTHHVLNEDGLSSSNIVNGIPIVQAGARGRYLGSVDITLRYGTAAVSSARLIPVADLPVDKDFEANVIQSLIEEARPILGRPLGRLANDSGLSTVFLRNCFAAEELPLANFVTDGLVKRCHANDFAVDLAIIDSGDVSSGLPLMPHVTLGMWLRVMPFADTIQLFSLTGQQLLMLVNDNAMRVDLPGEPHTERGFLQFSGSLRYTIKIPGRQRSSCYASEIQVDGAPLEAQLDREFLVACSSHIRHACSPWEKNVAVMLKLPLLVLAEIGTARMDTGLLISRELIAYIQEQGGLLPESGAKVDGRLRLDFGS